MHTNLFFSIKNVLVSNIEGGYINSPLLLEAFSVTLVAFWWHSLGTVTGPSGVLLPLQGDLPLSLTTKPLEIFSAVLETNEPHIEKTSGTSRRSSW